MIDSKTDTLANSTQWSRVQIHPILLSMIVVASATCASTPRVEVSYDRFRDVTIVGLKDAWILTWTDRGFEHIGVSAFYVSAGQTSSIAVNDRIMFGLHIHSTTWRFLHTRGLILIVDGVRINLGEMDHDGYVGNGHVIEHMGVTIPVPVFLKIVKATKVEAQLGSLEFTFPEPILTSMRELAHKIESK